MNGPLGTQLRGGWLAFSFPAEAGTDAPGRVKAASHRGLGCVSFKTGAYPPCLSGDKLESDESEFTVISFGST